MVRGCIAPNAYDPVGIVNLGRVPTSTGRGND